MIAPANGHHRTRFSRLVDPSGRPLRLGYDATENKKRRRPSTGLLQSEDKQLPPSKRRDLVSEMRDLQRNFALAAWAIRKHLDFVSTFTFASKNGDKGLDDRVNELMEWWDRPESCDAAGRHPLSEIIRLAEARAVVDGDIGLLKVRDGRVQGIEGDRIRTPWNLPPGAGVKASDLTHGVKTDAASRALAYCVCRRGKDGTGFHFERMVPARHLLLHGYFDRFDQVRGISPIGSGYNTFQDTRESVEYALLKAKISQLFGLKIKLGGDEESPGREANKFEDGDDTTESDEEKAGYQVDFGSGPFKLELDPGDDADFMESKTPSAEFKDFIITVIGISLKAIDIPYCFYDEAWTNFFGSKAALALYLKSCRRKRRNLLTVLRKLTYWRLHLFVLDGVLELPRKLTVPEMRFDWIPDGMPWWDQAKEVAGDVAAIAAGLRSRREIRKERFGDDWFRVIDELAEEEGYIREKEVTISSPAINVNVGVAPKGKGNDEDE